MAFTPGLASQLYVSLLTIAVASFAYGLLHRARVRSKGKI